MLACFDQLERGKAREERHLKAFFFSTTAQLPTSRSRSLSLDRQRNNRTEISLSSVPPSSLSPAVEPPSPCSPSPCSPSTTAKVARELAHH